MGTRQVILVKIINIVVPDAWYRKMIGHVVKVVDNGNDYVVMDQSITHDRYGEFNNSGLICKLDAREVNNE